MILKSVMQQVTGWLSHLWAVILILGVMVLFIGMDDWSHQLARFPFMKVHPRYSGGEISETVEDENGRWIIHRPVFDGLLRSRSEGFLQVDVIPSGQGTDFIGKDIDYDRDGETDFRIEIDGSPDHAPIITSHSKKVGTLERWARTEEGWIVRVAIHKE
jgi:hypothetical protein